MTDRKIAEEARRESEHRIRGIVERMSSGVAVYAAVGDGEDFVFVDFNRAGERIEKVDREQVIGRRVTEVFPGVRDFGLLDVLRRVWQSGKPEHHPVGQYKDRRITGWRENFVYRLPSGEVVAVYDDVTERKRTEETLKLLVRELDHRVKNTLATVDSLAEQTLQSSASLAEFSEAFRGRIRALARMHESREEHR
jgi:PAS domain S-box-containing protein